MPTAADVDGRRDLAVHRSHVRVGLFLVAVNIVGVSTYLLMTPDGANRPSMWLLVASHAVSLATIPLLPLNRLLAASASRLWFFGAWSGFAVVSLTVGVFLDDGAGSPLVATLAAPMVYAAVIYPPRGVVLVGLGVQVALLVIFLSAPAGGTESGAAELPVMATVGLTIALSGAMVARITQRQLLREQQLTGQLRELALADGLTGCLNHRAFHERLSAEVDHALRNGGQLALILADIDQFKQVNDVHGHPVGDAVLTSVAGIMRDGIRPNDVVGRLGGEEFAVLMVGVGWREAVALAERIRAAVETQTEPVAVTISLGVCCLSTEAASVVDLLAEADRALYAAKRGGRNRVTSSATMPVELIASAGVA